MHVGYIHYERFASSGTPEAARPIGRPARPKPQSAAGALRRNRAFRERGTLDIIIANGSSKPIYEQIADQIKAAIMSGELTAGDALPSIRALASDLRISVITTKRAYAELEEAGFIDTVQGKGSFVAGGNLELLREERLRQVEALMAQAVAEARGADISPADLREMLDVLLED